MEAQIPEWINAELFEGVVKKNAENYEKILNFSVEPAFGSAGENYLSIMLSVKVEVEFKDGSTKTMSYMLKLPPTAEQAKRIVDSMSFFKKEAIMYNELIPAFEEIYEQAGKEVKLGPKSYVFDKDVGVDVVLLEDLRPYGFKNINRLEGLDMEHSKRALRILAEYHAVSAAYLAKKGQFPEPFMKPFLTEQVCAMFEQAQKSQNDKFVDSLPLYKAEHMKEKILKFQTLYMSLLVQSEKVDPNEFYVLSHGDCWSNNIMFQYDNQGQVKDTLFVDFQVCKYATPANDLQNLIMSSTSFENKLKYFDYFVQYYHDNLVENLKLLKYDKKIPSLKEFHIKLFKYSCFAYTTILKALPVVLLDPKSKADISIDNMMGEKADGSAMQHYMYTNPNYVKHVEKLLPWMENRGYFEN